jgi:hypothetical protein
MIEEIGSDARFAGKLKNRGMRGPYVKPFVRNLDTSETEGKPLSEVEQTDSSGVQVGTAS